jgi:hypothetical protein
MVNDNEVVILFVKFAPGVDISEAKKKIVKKIRSELSPKHVPSEIVKVSEIPYNINFKKMEILVKKLLDGQDVRYVLLLWPGELSSEAEKAARVGVREKREVQEKWGAEQE